jgi:hypothetical protein
MVGILREAYQKKHVQGRGKSKFFLEDQMLLTLEYGTVNKVLCKA